MQHPLVKGNSWGKMLCELPAVLLPEDAMGTRALVPEGYLEPHNSIAYSSGEGLAMGKQSWLVGTLDVKP